MMLKTKILHGGDYIKSMKELPTSPNKNLMNSAAIDSKNSDKYMRRYLNPNSYYFGKM